MLPMVWPGVSMYSEGDAAEIDPLPIHDGGVDSEAGDVLIYALQLVRVGHDLAAGGLSEAAGAADVVGVPVAEHDSGDGQRPHGSPGVERRLHLVVVPVGRIDEYGAGAAGYEEDVGRILAGRSLGPDGRFAVRWMLRRLRLAACASSIRVCGATSILPVRRVKWESLKHPVSSNLTTRRRGARLNGNRIERTRARSHRYGGPHGPVRV